jgi:hypothetical protein
MPLINIIPATTAAVDVTYNTEKYETVIAVADSLDGAEEVDILIQVVGDSYIDYYDTEGNVVKLTTARPVTPIPAGPRYKFTKSSTATEVPVSLWLNRSMARR